MNYEKTTSAKRKNGRKSTLTGRDCRILRRLVSENHGTTAAQVSFKNPTSSVGMQLLNL
jgi:hypothetical protein